MRPSPGAFVVLTLLLAGCSAAPEEAPTEGTAAGISLRSMAWGDFAEIDEPAREAFTDVAAWEAFWERLTGRGPPGSAPRVDFANETALAAAAGPVPDSCSTLRISDPRLADGEVRVNVTLHRQADPGGAAACHDAVERPWHIVAVSLPRARVVWEEREATGAPP